MKVITCEYFEHHFSEVIRMLHDESITILSKKHDTGLKATPEGIRLWIKPSFEVMARDVAKGYSMTLNPTSCNISESDLQCNVNVNRSDLRNRMLRVATVRYEEILRGLE